MASFWGEIKRRKVFQVAAVYAVVAWLTIQVIGAVNAPLKLPDWLDTVVIVLLAVGFPIAVILAWAFDVTPAGVTVTKPYRAGASPPPAAATFTYVVQGLVLIAVAFLLVDQYLLSDAQSSMRTVAREDARDTRVTKLSIAQPPEQPIRVGINSPMMALSPDGRHIVYQAAIDGRPKLVARDLGSFETRVLYEGGFPWTSFFSPDGEWVGFIEQQGATLKRVPVSGGTALTISALAGARLAGAAWKQDDTIIFGMSPGSSGLWQVPAGGGTPEPFTTLDESRGEYSHRWPYLLPDERALLFTVFKDEIGSADADIVLWDLETGEHHVLISGGSYPMYVSGHLVYGVAGTLRAVPFDLERLTVTGNPAVVLEGVMTRPTSGAADVALSADGTLAYLSGEAGGGNLGTLVWISRDGTQEPLGFGPFPLVAPAVSPDQTRVAGSVQNRAGGRDLLTWSLQTQTPFRVTFDQAVNSGPIWAPDATRIVYAIDGEGLFVRNADATGEAERIVAFSEEMRAYDWTEDDTLLLAYRTDAGHTDIGSAAVGKDQAITGLLESPFNETRPSLSPDGRWLVYQSDETGRFEIYVRPFPDIESGKWAVTDIGAENPRWSPDGGTIYMSSSNRLMATNMLGETPTSGFSTPELLLDLDEFDFRSTSHNYDVAPDGRLLLIRRYETASPQLNVVLNWNRELEQKVPIRQQR